MQVASYKDKNPVYVEMSFYGVITEIWHLDYNLLKIPVFKCDWVDSKKGVKVDELGFTLVELGRIGHKSDSFILASQAKQVFYVKDQLDSRWSIVLEPPQHRYPCSVDDDLNDCFAEPQGFDRVLPEVESLDETDDLVLPPVRGDCEGMMDSDDNHPSNEDNTTPSSTDPKCKKRKGRGATRLPDVIKDRSSGMRKATFDVDLRSKKGVLSSIATCLRTFRKYLTKHIYANKSNPIILSKPPEAYSFLEQQEWDSFVKRRLTKEFEEFRGVQQRRRKCNLYDHRLSRKGYFGLEEEIANKSEEAVVSVDRSISWKKARQNKNGEYGDIKTKEKAVEIDEIAKQVEDGTLQTQGSNDILTMALSGTERGCVRGVGGKVTPTMYFHVPRRGNHSRCEEKQKSLLQIVSQMQVQLDAIAQHMPDTPKSDNIG
ncbi:uncharacterized protein LOC131309621 [Rhododendron vialii]|uniref:uncharacterized protein LOC131309621 n=1 Tax=Rhododendron vialii TaxID=182163 RepID=UPI00265E4952|nr:uncharacterized protein LOC131309621 [Rhododendron vialii]